MYTSYSSLGCRSRSTADIFKAQSLDNASHPPMTYGTTLTRTSSSITMSNVNRRRRAAGAPAPPRRSDSFAGVVVPSVLKRARANEARRRLIETSTPIITTQTQTPRTKFVKKLVASLERRQKEINGACSKLADDEFFVSRNFRRDESLALIQENERMEKIVNTRADIPQQQQQQQHTYTR